MIKINQVKIPVKSSGNALLKKCAKILGVKESEINKLRILRHSIDARKEELFDVYQVAVSLQEEERILKHLQKKKPDLFTLYKPMEYDFFRRSRQQHQDRRKLCYRPVIVGAGPAGYFCGLMLAEHGFSPLIIERGKPVEKRKQDVEKFFTTGVLDPESNVQFGEGGAGAFSDGKLNTLVKDQEGRSRKVLELFVEFGADEDILFENKPHVGTDVLHEVLVNLRRKYIELGGEIRFETQVSEFTFRDGKIKGITLSDGTELPAQVCVLAIGHSARDTFDTLSGTGIHMEAKSFAVGFRVEHPQSQINISQYGETYADTLPAAPYKLTATASDGRGVYSFCMCPGGYVVNASSEEKKLAVNGMSYRSRAGKNANSAIIVSVSPEDFPDQGALGGVHFQQEIERKAYELGKGRIPQQLFGDFKCSKASHTYGEFESQTKGQTCFANLRAILPEVLNQDFIEGMQAFGQKISGFDREDAILSGIESRTSSPVRITRNEQMQSNIEGVFPCGEGAGYAGGIMSAAMDGLKVAEQIAALYEP